MIGVIRRETSMRVISRHSFHSEWSGVCLRGLSLMEYIHGCMCSVECITRSSFPSLHLSQLLLPLFILLSSIPEGLRAGAGCVQDILWWRHTHSLSIVCMPTTWEERGGDCCYNSFFLSVGSLLQRCLPAIPLC